MKLRPMLPQQCTVHLSQTSAMYCNTTTQASMTLTFRILVLVHGFAKQCHASTKLVSRFHGRKCAQELTCYESCVEVVQACPRQTSQKTGDCHCMHPARTWCQLACICSDNNKQSCRMPQLHAVHSIPLHGVEVFSLRHAITLKGVPHLLPRNP